MKARRGLALLAPRSGSLGARRSEYDWGVAMSFDLVMRTLGVLTCLYTVAYFVTTMSVAALNGVTYSSGPMCGTAGCVAVAQQHRLQQNRDDSASDAPLWTAASFLSLE
jgi:hypothetical protein